MGTAGEKRSVVRPEKPEGSSLQILDSNIRLVAYLDTI